MCKTECSSTVECAPSGHQITRTTTLFGQNARERHKIENCTEKLPTGSLIQSLGYDTIINTTFHHKMQLQYEWLWYLYSCFYFGTIASILLQFIYDATVSCFYWVICLHTWPWNKQSVFRLMRTTPFLRLIRQKEGGTKVSE